MSWKAVPAPAVPRVIEQVPAALRTLDRDAELGSRSTDGSGDEAMFQLRQRRALKELGRGAESLK